MILKKVDIINTSEKDGSLKKLIASGVVAPTILHWREIYYHVDFRIKSGQKKMDIYSFFSDQLGIHETTVRKAYYEMKREFEFPDEK